MPTTKPNYSCPILPRSGRRLTPFWHDVVPIILQASSIEDKDVGLVEGIFNYFLWPMVQRRRRGVVKEAKENRQEIAEGKRDEE